VLKRINQDNNIKRPISERIILDRISTFYHVISADFETGNFEGGSIDRKYYRNRMKEKMLRLPIINYLSTSHLQLKKNPM
jgi:hypothetical protein